MEINCPDCSQRLRVPDHLQDPLVRCRNCGRTFRPSETAESRIPFAIPVREPEPLIELQPVDEKSSNAQLHDFLSQPRVEPSVADQAKTKQKTIGWGAGLLIALMVLRGGAKLVKHLMRDDRKPQPAPVQFDPKLRPEIQKLFEQGGQLPPPPPPLPLRELEVPASNNRPPEN